MTETLFDKNNQPIRQDFYKDRQGTLCYVIPVGNDWKYIDINGRENYVNWVIAERLGRVDITALLLESDKILNFIKQHAQRPAKSTDSVLELMKLESDKINQAKGTGIWPR